MSALPRGPTNWSPIDAVYRWCRDWTESATELDCCAEEEVEHIAKDVGVSASELRRLASRGPHSADLLLSRMAELDLDENEVVRTEPAVFRDLQRVCTMCESQRRCRLDLARDPTNPVWKAYCPNAATLTALSAQPWAAQREW